MAPISTYQSSSSYLVFIMPNIYRFFCDLYLESINGSLNNPRLTLSPYGLRGAFLKSYWAVSVS